VGLTFGLVALVLLAVNAGLLYGYRKGKRHGQRLEVRAMIELMEAIKIDCYEQRIFRDRFVKALKWSLSKRTDDEGGD
jgi:hypothetical protein